MSPTLETFATYFARVAPGVVLGALMLYLARREARLRIVLYLALFVLLRDTMTPLGLWFSAQGLFWIRLPSDPWFLITFGVFSLGSSLGLYFFDRENRPLVRWTRDKILPGLLWGIGGAAVVVAPLVVMYRYTPIADRGGAVALRNLPAILVFALLGNLLEETLFRGYVYGHLAQKMAPITAGIASGVVFAFCHVFLATTVTANVYSVLGFTLWEGIIVGIVGAKGGVIPSTVAHGGVIFLLSSGLM